MDNSFMKKIMISSITATMLLSTYIQTFAQCRLSPWENKKGIGLGVLNSLYGDQDRTVQWQKVTNYTPLNTNELEYQNSSKQIKVVFNNHYTSHTFFQQKVDIFAILNYETTPCGKVQTHTYGGVTLHDGNQLASAKNIPTNIFLDGVQQKVKYDAVSTDKKMVTVQEIDYKARHYLIKTYNIYKHTNYSYTYGRIIFHMNNGQHFCYDLYYQGDGSSQSILEMYKDNKTIDSREFHLDIELSKTAIK
ncbi:TPA: hypothetical protein TUU90_000973 [Streptococcus equi subsp. zooepidemicus]|nr:hypothetical protein [Streptococcus equi subsp. zooepidemicus]